MVSLQREARTKRSNESVCLVQRERRKEWKTVKAACLEDNAVVKMARVGGQGRACCLLPGKQCSCLKPLFYFSSCTSNTFALRRLRSRNRALCDQAAGGREGMDSYPSANKYVVVRQQTEPRSQLSNAMVGGKRVRGVEEKVDRVDRRWVDGEHSLLLPLLLFLAARSCTPVTL